MAEPITWRNVTGPSLAEASRPLDSAQRMIGNSFDALSGLINQQETTDRANWNAVKANNTQTVRDAYMGMDAEQFAQAQKDGTLRNLMQGFSAQVDRPALNQELDARQSTLQQRDKQAAEYQNFMTDQRQLPVVQQIMSEAALGNKTKALELMAQNPDLRLPAELTKSIVAGERDLARWGHEQDKMPIELQGMKLRNAGQGQQNALGAINLTKAQREEKDAAELRKLQNTLAIEQQKHIERSDALGRDMGALAAELKLPVSASGLPKFSEMSDKQIELFDQTATARGKPTSAAYSSGDTNAAKNFTKQLRDSGMFRPEILAKSGDAINSAFDSTAGAGLVGNDALNRQLRNARKEVYFDEKDRTNWYRPGSNNARVAYLDIAKEVDGMLGKDEKEDLPKLQKELYDISVNGIKVARKNAEGKMEVVSVVPSKEDVMAAVRSTEEGLFFNSQRASRVRSFLQKAAKNANTIQMVEDGEESAEYRRDQLVKEKLYGKDKDKK